MTGQLLIIDGPEKAGKTTLIHELVGAFTMMDYLVRTRKWGPTKIDDREYSPAIQEDIAWTGLTIWDRSWASESVYGTLLKRDKRLAENPWLGEWMHSRAMRPWGARIMLLGPGNNGDLRDETDLPVDPVEERDTFRFYGNLFGWEEVLENEHTEEGTFKAVQIITRSIEESAWHHQGLGYFGNPNPLVVFVDEFREKAYREPGAWGPFSDRYGTELGEALGIDALKCGWVTAHQYPPSLLRGIPTIVSCGKGAGVWVKNYVIQGKPGMNHIEVKSPAWIYAYKKAAKEREHLRSILDDIAEAVQVA
jgi:hypothetical protein